MPPWLRRQLGYGLLKPLANAEPAPGETADARPTKAEDIDTAELELELELVQSHMTQKPMLRGEVDARALRVQVRSWVGGSGKRDKCNALGCWRGKSLWR